MLLAVVQRFHRAVEQGVPDALFLLVGDQLVLQRAIVDQEVLPLVLGALVALKRRVEAGVAAHRHAAVHRDDLVLGDAEVGRDLGHVRGLEVAFLERVDLVFHPPEVEEQLLLGGGGADLHQRPAAQDEFLDARADPPHGIGREAEAPVGLELLDALHQPDVALGDELGDRQAIAAIPHGDLGHESQVRIDQPRGRVGIVMLAPALGEHILFLGREDGELLDLAQITVEPGVACAGGDR